MPLSNVGGSVSGVTPQGVLCRNLTTGQVIAVQTSDTSWDREALGLVANSGDPVLDLGDQNRSARADRRVVEQDHDLAQLVVVVIGALG